MLMLVACQLVWLATIRANIRHRRCNPLADDDVVLFLGRDRGMADTAPETSPSRVNGALEGRGSK